jgi:HD-GYP domain-containing protein (c-di-GMP phosphodiesterase class II)
MLGSKEFRQVHDRAIAAVLLGLGAPSVHQPRAAAGVSAQRRGTALEHAELDLLAAPERSTSHTALHEQRVSQLCLAIAKRLGLAAAAIERLGIAASVHDIGKAAIPSAILMKAGPLSAEEMELLRTHPRQGYIALGSIGFEEPIAAIVAQHHERLDGSGYPRALRGDEIFVEARILAVADVVEAMSSHRPYRPAPGLAMALQEIERGRGRLFDETVVDACLAIFRTNSFEFETEDAFDDH